VTRGAVTKAFQGLGSVSEEIKDENVLEKCQRMCQEHDLSPTDLAYKWEAYIDKVCATLFYFIENCTLLSRAIAWYTKCSGLTCDVGLCLAAQH